tara:strand:- start:286 stop:396 length:111 start_codon:yes stop_codon:yes gene_type:complete
MSFFQNYKKYEIHHIKPILIQKMDQKKIQNKEKEVF